MRAAFIKLLLAITVSAMVALAVMGVYIVALQSQDNPIVAPIDTVVAPVNGGIQQLPSQAPRHELNIPKKRYVPPVGMDSDSPTPR